MDEIRCLINGMDITDSLDRIVIQTGTKNSDVTILKLRYLDGSVDTKVLLTHDLRSNHKLVRR